MTFTRHQRSPLGAFYRSPLNAFGAGEGQPLPPGVACLEGQVTIARGNIADSVFIARTAGGFCDNFIVASPGDFVMETRFALAGNMRWPNWLPSLEAATFSGIDSNETWVVADNVNFACGVQFLGGRSEVYSGDFFKWEHAFVIPNDPIGEGIIYTNLSTWPDAIHPTFLQGEAWDMEGFAYVAQCNFVSGRGATQAGSIAPCVIPQFLEGAPPNDTDFFTLIFHEEGNVVVETTSDFDEALRCFGGTWRGDTSGYQFVFQPETAIACRTTVDSSNGATFWDAPIDPNPQHSWSSLERVDVNSFCTLGVANVGAAWTTFPTFGETFRKVAA